MAKAKAMETTETTTGLAKVEPQELGRLTEDKWKLIQRTFAKEATPDEFALFRSVAEREGLDPFTRQIHFIKRKAGDVSFVVGVHGLVARLNRVPGFRGIQSSVVCAKDTFEADPITGTVTHRFKAADRGPIVGAWARGQLGDRAVVFRYVSIDEYRGQSPLWREKPATMLEKVAIVQCARALAPEELHGLYAPEELGGETRGDAVVMPSKTAPIEDDDAKVIALALTAILTVPDRAALDACLVSIREEAKTWPPSARKLFASHVERRKQELPMGHCPSCGDESPTGETCSTCAESVA